MTKDVVLIPSLGRPASDFALLERDLEFAGFHPISIDPLPSWSGEPTLHDLARWVVEFLDERAIDRFHLVGHAFGNRLSRCITADFSSRVESLTLLAAGGLVDPEPHIWHALTKCFDMSLSAAEHLSYVQEAFFADGNDARVWSDGWMPEVMRYQRGAVQRTSRDEWWPAQVNRVLVVQALQDAIAPVENGRRYKLESAPHAQLVEIANAGHAMLPEQPHAISDAVVAFLSE